MSGDAMRAEVASVEDIPAIAGLFNLVFGAGRDPETWRRLYAATPAGQPVSFVMRSAEGYIAGHLGAIPAVYRRGENKARGALLVDFMVHPDWAGRGVGSRLERAVHEILAEGFHFSFGFSNRKSVSVSSKSGMGFLGRSPVYLRLPRRAFSWRLGRGGTPAGETTETSPPGAGHRVKSGAIGSGDGSMRLTPVSDLDDLDDGFEGGAAGPDLWHRSRDVPTLKWRYGNRPEGPYAFFVLEEGGERSGYLVLARRRMLGRDTGVIVDLHLDDYGRTGARFLLSSAVDVLSQQGVDIINCMYRGSGKVTSSLVRMGFLRLPQRFLLSQLNLNLKIYDDLGGMLAEDIREWCFTWGDTDLV